MPEEAKIELTLNQKHYFALQGAINIYGNCQYDMWYAPKPADSIVLGGSRREPLGRCRKRAPTMGGYPAVMEIDWCGDHKLDENKV